MPAIAKKRVKSILISKSSLLGNEFDRCVSCIENVFSQPMLIPTVVRKALIQNISKGWKSGAMATFRLHSAGVKPHFLSQTEAAALDQELFNEYKFSVDQLMELAGLSVACAVARVYPPKNFNSALIICGPGNNGGDGLVAARHMLLFGYCVEIYYPKRTPKPLYENLLEQCKKFGINIIDNLPKNSELKQHYKQHYKLIVDALFGFSYKPPVRDDLKPALAAMVDTGIPVCSVDVPSGWHVENGPQSLGALKPSLLISLSAPKLCARPEILGNAHHYLGGRFLPKAIIEKYKLILPTYPGEDQVVDLIWNDPNEACNTTN